MSTEKQSAQGPSEPGEPDTDEQQVPEQQATAPAPGPITGGVVHKGPGDETE